MAQDWQRKRGTARLLPVAAVLALAACAAPPPTAPPQAAPPADPSLQAVATGTPNMSQTTAAGTVTITADYISAAGHECRAYTLAAPNAPPVRKLACNDGGWHGILPLIQTGTTAP